jgi:flagellar basal-body rod modification protein FlgD
MSSYIDSINQATTTATGTSTAKSANDAAMGKQDFLMLLVAQLQNQDPLNPSDPTEFTAQLAQFSSLEQLFTLNESMTNLATSNANADRFTTLNTIGKDVTYHGSGFNFTGEPVEIGYQLDGKASEVTLSLKHNGVTIATIKGTELDSGSHFITWDGALANNKSAPLGDYEIVLEAKAAGDDSVGAAPLIRSEVTGVDLEGDYGGVLITKAGQVAFTSILGVYEPGSVATTTEDEE